MASANRAKLATSKLLTGPTAPFAKSANLAFVAPMSPSKTCSAEIDSSHCAARLDARFVEFHLTELSGVRSQRCVLSYQKVNSRGARSPKRMKA